MDAKLADSLVNKTAIDAHTNRRIGGNAPSKYLDKLEKQDKIPADQLDAILRSHDIDPVLLRDDDFTGFFTHRFERLLKQIEEAMGKPVNRSPDGGDNPYAGTLAGTQDVEQRLRDMIAGGETKVVEFKSTARLNLHTQDKDPAVEWGCPEVNRRVRQLLWRQRAGRRSRRRRHRRRRRRLPIRKAREPRWLGTLAH